MSDNRLVKSIIEGRITPKEESYTEDESTPVFLRAQNIEEGYLTFVDVKRLKLKAFQKESKAILLDGDIVLTIDGVLLGIAAVHRVSDTPCCVSNHMVRIVAGNAIIPDYLSWFLNSPAGQHQIKRGITGSAIPGIRTDAIERIWVPLPPLPIQQELVEEMEQAREARKRRLEQADALLSGLDEYLLERLGLTVPKEQENKAFAVKRGDLVGHRIDAPAYRPFFEKGHPPKTPVQSLISIAQINPPTGEKPSDETSLVPYIGLPECDLTEIREVAMRPYFEIKGRSAFKAGDILFARIEPSVFNKKYVLADDLKGHDFAFTSTEFYVVRPHEGMNRHYLYSMFFCSFVFAQVRGKTTGSSGRRRIDSDLFKALMIPVPSKPIQDEIAKEVKERRMEARRLREEADRDWNAAKARFEARLLGKENISKKD